MTTRAEMLAELNKDRGYYRHADMANAVQRYFNEFGTIEDVCFLTLSEEQPTRGQFISMVNRAIKFKERITEEQINSELFPALPEDAVL